MRPSFWLERWENGQTGFNLEKPNPFLQKFYTQLSIQPGDPVFVPLCGKSIDMKWLADQGHPVMGVELSAIAAEEFFEANDLTPTVSAKGKFTSWQGGDIEILVGNFFDLTPDDLRDVKAVYDRAALIALPQPMRQDYAKHMSEIISPMIKVLLITIFYHQNEMSGPPHSVPTEEVRQLFDSNFLNTELDKRDVLDKVPRFREGGLTMLEQHIYLLDRL
ncbi:MAG: thiopurine S-methyltransferase [Chloroflexota bacterium]